MASNLFRFTIIGEALEASIKEVQEKNGLSNEVCEKIREKFDEVANKVVAADPDHLQGGSGH